MLHNQTSLNTRALFSLPAGQKALIPYFTAGDPSLSDLPSIIRMLEDSGADAIEFGLPFSDPIADGPVIQASTQRALDRGVTTLQVLETLQSANATVPLVLMGYYNPILRIGVTRFAGLAKTAGVAATIVSDLTPEEADPWIAASVSQGLKNIFLAAPTSTDLRLDKVCEMSTGFVYAVSRTGVTGNSIEAPPEVRSLVTRLKSRTDLPVCVGFGISKPEHVRMVCEVADGAVVGSFLVNLLAEKWNSPGGPAEIARIVRELKDATR